MPRMIPPQTRAEAAAWLARLRADDKSAADEQAFRSWLARDPSHAAAFEAVTEAWETAGAIRPMPQTTALVTRRQAVLAATGALAMAGAYVAFSRPAEAKVYETAVGEQKHVVLEDGTQAFLDTDTRLRVRFEDRTRLVDFERGRCGFHVLRGRPFVVDAAGLRIAAGPAQCDVQRDGQDVAVILTQGAATVTGRALRQPCVLRPGNRLVVAGDRVRVDAPALARVLAWQTGQAVFENDTLAYAFREMNRYSAVKLAAGDSAVAGMRISGVYRVGDNDAFARSVAALLPVSVEIGTNQIRLFMDPSRTKGA